MTLAVGTTLGPYEVTAQIGAGGMGEVYRARDPKLNRDVALKVLPEAVADDPERLARFRREAQVLAALNHPNIAAIYGLEDSGETHALVLELVEGPTLQDRIAQGAIPLDEALPIAKQIAEALEAAHEQGIIHRDLKPANIKVTPEGVVKVLDFGLAKALEPERSDQDVANSPTMSMTAAATRAGFILGTAAYMSPEQARGKPVDRRADAWAYGVVLYEMLTGRQTFGGSDVSETLAAVLRQDMDWTALPPETPQSVRRLLQRCLKRDPKSRLADLSMARLEIDEADIPDEVLAAGGTVPADLPALWQRPLPLALGVLLLLAVTGAASWRLARPVTPSPVTRYAVTLPPGNLIGAQDGMALSPDGERLVYASRTNDGVRQLFLRQRDQMTASPIPDTEGGVYPFFSPDGQWVGFFAGNALKKVSLVGGPAVTLCPAGRRYGASWGPDGTIVFSSGASPGLMQVSVAGGEPTTLTTPPETEEHRFPVFTRGGRAVLFTITDTVTNADHRIAVVSLDTGEQKILRGGSSPRITSSGHLVFGQRETLSLWAVPFDEGRLMVTGEAAPVIEDVQVNSGGWAHYDVADDGSLVYLPSESGASRTLAWVDRNGNEEILAAEPRTYGRPRISPDGTRVAIDDSGDEADVWIWNVARGGVTRLTFSGSYDSSGVWTRDGERFVFSSGRDGAGDLYWRNADGTGTVERLTDTQRFKHADTISPDGAHLVFTERQGTNDNSLYVLTLDDRRVEPLIVTEFGEQNAELSPDGRWLAYESDASGRSEIYVQPFPNVDAGRWQVSAAGGWTPLWRPDGQELFYRTNAGIWAVKVEPGEGFSFGAPRVVVPAGNFFTESLQRSYDISPDGERFLVLTAGASAIDEDPFAGLSRLLVVENWVEELKARVPTGQ